MYEQVTQPASSSACFKIKVKIVKISVTCQTLAPSTERKQVEKKFYKMAEKFIDT